MDYIIDYLTITIKSDKNSNNPYHLELDEVLNIFCINDIFDNFIDVGSRKFYQHCFTYNNIDFSPARGFGIKLVYNVIFSRSWYNQIFIYIIYLLR